MAIRKTPYVSIQLREETLELLRKTAIDLTTPTGRRVTLSEVVTHAIEVSLRHKTELVESLKTAKDLP